MEGWEQDSVDEGGWMDGWMDRWGMEVGINEYAGGWMN